MYYIQRKDAAKNAETVDEFETREEAWSMLAQYRQHDAMAFYYVSTKPFSEWESKS